MINKLSLFLAVCLLCQAEQSTNPYTFIGKGYCKTSDTPAHLPQNRPHHCYWVDAQKATYESCTQLCMQISDCIGIEVINGDRCVAYVEHQGTTASAELTQQCSNLGGNLWVTSETIEYTGGITHSSGTYLSHTGDCYSFERPATRNYEQSSGKCVDEDGQETVNEYFNYDYPSQSACEDVCDNDDSCVAYAFNWDITCWLFGEMSQPSGFRKYTWGRSQKPVVGGDPRFTEWQCYMKSTVLLSPLDECKRVCEMNTCEEAAHLTISSDQMLSCTNACYMRHIGVTSNQCLDLCDRDSVTGCELTVNEVGFNLCHGRDARGSHCVAGELSVSDCKLGCESYPEEVTTAVETTVEPVNEIDCVGIWSQWSTCSASCGDGTQVKTYSILKDAAGGGNKCPHAQGHTESQTCHLSACAVNCVGVWSQWSACSASCGDGTQVKTYSISKDAAHGGDECPHAQGHTESQTCNLVKCVNDQRNCIQISGAAPALSATNGIYRPHNELSSSGEKSWINEDGSYYVFWNNMYGVGEYQIDSDLDGQLRWAYFTSNDKNLPVTSGSFWYSNSWNTESNSSIEMITCPNLTFYNEAGSKQCEAVLNDWCVQNTPYKYARFDVAWSAPNTKGWRCYSSGALTEDTYSADMAAMSVSENKCLGGTAGIPEPNEATCWNHWTRNSELTSKLINVCGQEVTTAVETTVEPVSENCSEADAYGLMCESHSGCSHWEPLPNHFICVDNGNGECMAGVDTQSLWYPCKATAGMATMNPTLESSLMPTTNPTQPSMAHTSMPTVKPSREKSREPTRVPTLNPTSPFHFAAVANGATESNKNAICDSFAVALKGQRSYCSFQQTSAPRLRRLLTAQVLYVDILVADIDSASAQVEKEGFIDSLSDLPSGVAIINVFNPETTPICVHTTHWTSRFGQCNLYATRYHSHCSEDWDETDRSTIANDACPQCNACVFVEGTSDAMPEDPLTSRCANHECPRDAVVAYSGQNGCVCRCKPGRFGTDCAEASPVWMNEFVLKETVQKRKYSIEAVELFKQTFVDTGRNSVAIKVLGGSGSLDVVASLEVGKVTAQITEQLINQESSGGIAMFYGGECIQLILFGSVTSIEMEDIIRENLGGCEVSATFLLDGIYVGANQAISYAYHGSGSYLDEFEGPDRAVSTLGSTNAEQAVTLVNPPPPKWDDCIDNLVFHIMPAIIFFAIAWVGALWLTSKDFEADWLHWVKGFLATGDFVSDLGFCLSLKYNGYMGYYWILLIILILATVKSFMLFGWRAIKMFQYSQVVFWRNDMPGGFAIIPILFVMSGFSPLFYNLITTSNVDFPLHPDVVQNLPGEKLGHLVIENFASILITAAFFSQNEVQPLALLSLAFSSLMTFILLSQATLDSLMTANVVATHVESMTITVNGIDQEKVSKLTSRTIQKKMQTELGTKFIVNVWWTRTFEKNAEVYIILESFEDAESSIDTNILRKQIATYVGSLHGAKQSVYDIDGKRMSVKTRTRDMMKISSESTNGSPSGLHIQMSQIFTTAPNIPSSTEGETKTGKEGIAHKGHDAYPIAKTLKQKDPVVVNDLLNNVWNEAVSDID